MAWTGAIVLFVVAAATAIAVHVGQVAFELTGLPRHKAFFQALSCFTTTGFTTLEAEDIVNHPARRRIAVVLMILGNVGIVAFMATVVETLMADGLDQLGLDALVSGLTLILILLVIRFVPPFRWIERRLRLWAMKAFHFEPDPTEQVLNYADGYGVVRALVRDGSPVADKRLRDTHLAARRLIVLAIERDGKNYPIPGPEARIRTGDRLICYGGVADADQVINGAAPLDKGEWLKQTMEFQALRPDEVAAFEGTMLANGAPVDDEEALGRGYTIMRKALEREEIWGPDGPPDD